MLILGVESGGKENQENRKAKFRMLNAELVTFNTSTTGLTCIFRSLHTDRCISVYPIETLKNMLREFSRS